jgi:ribosome recycling factor
MLPRAKEIVDAADLKMQETVDFLVEDLKTYRLGRANPNIFDGVTVDYYGSPTPLSQCATVSTPDACTLLIQPWDRSLLKKLQKAIIDANIGLTPTDNGEVIRCTVPPLTEERRKELIKKAKAAGENTKVIIRNARRDAVDQLKKAQKASEITEDVQREGEDEIQKVTDKNVKTVDGIIAEKEKDILTV